VFILRSARFKWPVWRAAALRGLDRVYLCPIYARRMGQPTQRATNYTARSNNDTAQIFLYANGQRPKRAMIRQRSRRRQRREARGATHRARPRSPSRLYTHSHELPALTALAQHISHSHSGIDEKRPTEKFVYFGERIYLCPTSMSDPTYVVF